MLRVLCFAVALALLPLTGACGGKSESEDGFSLSITLTHGNNSRPYLPWPADVAKQVAGDLEDVGFEVRVEQQPWSSYIPNVENGRHQMAILGWSADVPDTDNFLYALLHSASANVGSANNISFYRNPAFDAKLDGARASHDEAERNRLYEEAQKLVFQDVPMVPIVYTDRMIAHDASYGPLSVEFVTHPVLRLVKQPADGTLTFLRGADSNNLDAGDVTDGESSKVIEQIYDTLVRYRSGSIEVEPSLATSWSSNEDKTVWTFQIREGVKFHDGTALDGAAVVNTFERMRDPKHKHHFADGEFSNWKGLFGFVEKVELGSNAMEVVFRCKQAAPPFFLKQLAMFTCSIVSPAALDKHGAKFGRNPVGTGPFKFVRWDSGSEIVLERFDEFWGEKPALKQVLFKVAPNATVRSNRLISGSVQLIDNLSPATIGDLESKQNLKVARRPKSSLCYVSMNTMKPPFNNPKLRLAVAYALNKERIIKLAYKGYASPAHVPVPPGFNGHAAGLADRPYDPDKAKALIAEARKEASEGK